MLNIKQIANVVGKFTTDNSPLILTAIGVTGTITTAVLTGRASYRAAELIADDLIYREEVGDSDLYGRIYLTKKEKLKLVWPLYIAAVSTGVGTVTCIILANKIGTRRAAAMAAAYTTLDKGFAEYREKIVEKLGEGPERKARDEVAQDRMNKHPMSNAQIHSTGNGDVPCYDVWTGRYFQSSMAAIKEAMNDTNYQINRTGYASLNDFYSRLGLPSIPMGEELGWRDTLMDIQFSFTATDDGLNNPAHSITFYAEPVRNYFRAH